MKSLVLFSLIFAASMPVAPAFACAGALHMETHQTGVYSIDYAAAIGAQPTLKNCQLDRLYIDNQGKPVPIRIIDNGDGVFSQGDRIEWIATLLHGSESWFNPHSTVNVYELHAVPGAHPRMHAVHVATTNPAQPAALTRDLHQEQDRLMMRLKTEQVQPGDVPDLWFWWKITMIDPAPYSMHFDLADLRSEHGDLSMQLAFRGQSSVSAPKGQTKPADHTVIVTLNGHELATLAWNGNDHITRKLELPPNALRAQDNIVTLHVPKRVPAWSKRHNPLVDVVMFDYFNIHYPLGGSPGDDPQPFTLKTRGALALSTATPFVLYGSDGKRYLPSTHGQLQRYASAAAGTRLYPLAPQQKPLSPSGLREVHNAIDWHQPEHGYDYVMIAYPSLLDATKPLADYHRQHGLKVALINVNAVYDQFSHGIVTPNAIHDLLQYAYQHWPQPRPRYVLLVGDASFDIRSRKTVMKNYSTWTDRVLLRPGRYNVIPATPYADQPDVAGARNLIPTFQHYAAEGQSASDNGFVDFSKDSIHPSMAIGRFPVVKPDAVKAIVDKTIDYMRHPRMGDWRQRVMFITNDETSFQSQSNTIANNIGKLGFTADKIYPKTADKNNLDHQKAIMDGLDSGQLLVHFLGHGGRFIWRTGPPDPRKNHDLFTLDDVSDLRNAHHLPMVLSMTCYSAPFDNPTDDSIGERFLREAHNGAIAVFAASWRNTPDATFSNMLMEDLLQPGIRIGDAILHAKTETNNRDMIGMYNLLGDPALRLQRPQQSLRMQLVGTASAPRVRIAIPGAEFHGNLRVEWLDAKNQVLSTHDYQLDATHVTLPAPPAKASEVRVYAQDLHRDSDALGAISLQSTQPATPNLWQRTWTKLWQNNGKFTPLPAASDRLFGSNFGG
ncbi:MAG: C25 family cysteine peptidase [Xanthomonadales bacterium]|nr:C25 family cysteine peptidase [Xanthomonadales bacterium]